MKAAGLSLIIVGVLALLGGLFACFATLTSSYASLACEKAAMDKSAFDKARAACGSTTSPCYKQMTVGLSSEEECESKKAFMRTQLIMSIVPVVVGSLLAIVGFFLRRRKVAVA
jgi:hypothetical protein